MYDVKRERNAIRRQMRAREAAADAAQMEED